MNAEALHSCSFRAKLAGSLSSRFLVPETPTSAYPSAAAKKDSKALRGDLDTITLNALRKEPNRRYLTVEQLAADIDRYRRGLPMLARGNSTVYRLTKLARRQWLPLTAGAIVLISLAAGLLATSYQAHRVGLARAAADRARNQAEQERILADRQRQIAEQAQRIAVEQRSVAVVKDGANVTSPFLFTEVTTRPDLVAGLLTTGWAYKFGSPNKSYWPPASKQADKRPLNRMQLDPCGPGTMIAALIPVDLPRITLA